MACDIQGLLNSNPCYVQLSEKAQLALIADLLCQIAGQQQTLIGSGSPEGVITASVGRQYFDSSASHLYVKVTGSGNTGWQINT